VTGNNEGEREKRQTDRAEGHIERGRERSKNRERGDKEGTNKERGREKYK